MVMFLLHGESIIKFFQAKALFNLVKVLILIKSTKVSLYQLFLSIVTTGYSLIY